MTDELQRAMGRVEAKVDILLERSIHDEKRITAIEKKVWWASGASAVLAFIATKLPGLSH